MRRLAVSPVAQAVGRIVGLLDRNGQRGAPQLLRLVLMDQCAGRVPSEQAVIKAGQYAYRDRRQRKRQFRALWITRINAAARVNGMSYSRFVAGLKKAGIEIDRKVLADLAVHEKATFAAIVEKAKAA